MFAEKAHSSVGTRQRPHLGQCEEPKAGTLKSRQRLLFSTAQPNTKTESGVGRFAVFSANWKATLLWTQLPSAPCALEEAQIWMGVEGFLDWEALPSSLHPKSAWVQSQFDPPRIRPRQRSKQKPFS